MLFVCLKQLWFWLGRSTKASAGGAAAVRARRAGPRARLQGAGAGEEGGGGVSPRDAEGLSRSCDHF